MKKTICILITFLYIFNLISQIKANACELNEEYVPDEEFIISSSYITSLIGTDQKFTFKTPEITENPLEYELFPEGSPKPDDIAQGKSRICYLLAALSSIVENHPEIIKNSIKDNLDGTVTVKVFDLITAKPRLIKVQKTIPNVPRVFSVLNKECLWIQMLLKALIASNLSQRACCKFTNSMSYADIENGFAGKVLEMLTGKKVKNYNDSLIWKAGELDTYKIIENNIQNGSKIITCSFNKNRFFSLFHSFLPTSCSSDKGLIYGHVYSIVDAYEDSNKEKWIKVRNPWHSFSVAYDENGNRYIEPDDSKTEGYFSIKLNDFYKSCNSIQIVENDDLEAMNVIEKVKEKTSSVPCKLLTTAVFYFSISDLVSVDSDYSKIIIAVMSVFLSNILFY